MSSKILVVDDDAHLAQALDDLLTAEGYQVRQAHSAEQALEVCLREETYQRRLRIPLMLLLAARKPR